jgi:flagellar biosynthesis protein FlhB
MEGEKTEQPTPRKLKKARERGEVWKSADVIHTSQFAAMLVLGWLLVVLYIPRLRELFSVWPVLFAQLLRESAEVPADQLPLLALRHGTHVLLLALWPIILVPLFVGLLAAALQVRGVFSLQPLTPKPERLNPAANLKRMFSSRNVIDLVKTVVKVGIVGIVVYFSAAAFLPDGLRAVAAGSSAVVASALGQSLLAMSLACLALYVLMSGADFGHQFYEYMKQQRMTKDEVRREYKEIEGDPYVKGQRRAIGFQMATEEPSAGVAGAKVVITNPTHLSVALAYDPQVGGLPCVVAKGADAAALAIRREARRRGIAIVENKTLARQLYGRIAVGSFITADLFADVARLLASVPRLTRSTSDHWGRV